MRTHSDVAAEREVRPRERRIEAQRPLCGDLTSADTSCDEVFWKYGVSASARLRPERHWRRAWSSSVARLKLSTLDRRLWPRRVSAR
jgi:hypothetical protein